MSVWQIAVEIQVYTPAFTMTDRDLKFHEYATLISEGHFKSCKQIVVSVCSQSIRALQLITGLKC